MIKRLRIKFVIINMVMMTVMLCVILGMLYNFTQNNLVTENVSMMKAIAANPFQMGRPGEHSADLQLPYFSLQIGHRGELISTGGGYYDLSDMDLIGDLIADTMESGRETGVIKKHNLRFYQASNPAGTVLVFTDMSSEQNTLKNLLETSLFIGILSSFGFLGISIFLSRWAIKPVEKAWVQQKQFVADASHELKTPLTVIMTNSELLQNPDYSQEDKEQFSRSIFAMARQMRYLVERMLELARADNQQKQLVMTPVNFSKVIADAAISFEGVFFEKGLSLASHIEPDLCVHGNVQALQQVIDILLDNAGKYSSAGAETVIRLYSTGYNKCRLTVTNPGAPIAQADLTNIFRRFYRADKARSRDGSFGLGLPIAQNIIEQHHGKIWAESHNGLNAFCVELHSDTFKKCLQNRMFF